MSGRRRASVDGSPIGTVGGSSGSARLAQRVVERARRVAEQVGQAVAQQRDLLVELRQLRAQLREPRVGALHVELAR